MTIAERHTDHSPEHYRRALSASEARFRNIIDRSADGMIVMSQEGIIRFANPAARALLARTAEQLLGHPFGIPVMPGETTEIDIMAGGPDPRVAEMRVSESEWDGEPVLLATLRDITERKRLEQELRERARELAEADRRKDEFLAMLAHELRNPLAPIRVAIKIMRLREDPSVQDCMRELVERQVRHMAGLIDDLLDVSRITRGKVRLRKELVPLKTVIERAVEVAQPMVNEHRLMLSVSPPVEPVYLDADPVRLEQVLANLLNNAAKYTDAGGSVWLETDVVQGDVEIRVRDTGIGMEPEMLGRVFEPFTQAEQTLDRARGGLGIGLTLVSSLVALHGGTVRAESEGLGRGSQFTVRLPILHTIPPPAGEIGASLDRVHSRKLTILVVDDNASAAESLMILLGFWGHEVFVAYNGRDVLAMALEHRPHVVLLDIGLPGKNGYEVAEQLRSQASLAGVLLVATSGYGGEEDRRRCMRAGFDQHLVKPVDLEMLEEIIANPEVYAMQAGQTLST